MQAQLKKGLLLLTTCSLIVYVSYLYVDQGFAFWVYDQQLSKYTFLKGFTQIIEFLQYLTTLFYIYFIVKFLHQRVSSLDRKLLVIANSLALTYFFKDQLKYVFGRYWPQTWTHGNPSLIEHNEYGFHFFQGGSWYQSFPSGHTALAFAAMTALWLVFPRLRWLSISVCLLTIIGLLGMNYHFISDVIAGGVLGTIVGYSIAIVMGYKNLEKK